MIAPAIIITALINMRTAFSTLHLPRISMLKMTVVKVLVLKIGGEFTHWGIVLEESI